MSCTVMVIKMGEKSLELMARLGSHWSVLPTVARHASWTQTARADIQPLNVGAAQTLLHPTSPPRHLPCEGPQGVGPGA